ncbi:MAG: hypothetical protein K1X31_06500 [Gemmatimonadaceae bacterium]|nr:hypothetical protein [Gemmatimonadaceae bacterium]
MTTFTPDARAIWDQVPEAMRTKLLDSGFCSHCLATRHFALDEAEIRGKDLALIGKCGTCGHRVVRLVEI